MGQSAAGFLGHIAKLDECKHGCPGCPHPAAGPAICGSPNVTINDMPALRDKDKGMHGGCCGTNTWTATKASESVFINGKGAHRKDDETTHCGGKGKLSEGSDNVEIGD